MSAADALTKLQSNSVSINLYNLQLQDHQLAAPKPGDAGKVLVVQEDLNMAWQVGGGVSGVESVAATNSTILIAGTATNPTVAVNPQLTLGDISSEADTSTVTVTETKARRVQVTDGTNVYEFPSAAETYQNFAAGKVLTQISTTDTPQYTTNLGWLETYENLSIAAVSFEGIASNAVVAAICNIPDQGLSWQISGKVRTIRFRSSQANSGAYEFVITAAADYMHLTAASQAIIPARCGEGDSIYLGDCSLIDKADATTTYTARWYLGGNQIAADYSPTDIFVVLYLDSTGARIQWPAGKTLVIGDTFGNFPGIDFAAQPYDLAFTYSESVNQ